MNTACTTLLLLSLTRNYGPSGLRSSLRLHGDIIDIMYRFWLPKFEQREIQKHDVKQKGPKIFPLKTIINNHILDIFVLVSAFKKG